jgi:hypothetical protein
LDARPPDALGVTGSESFSRDDDATSVPPVHRLGLILGINTARDAPIVTLLKPLEASPRLDGTSVSPTYGPRDLVSILPM